MTKRAPGKKADLSAMPEVMTEGMKVAVTNTWREQYNPLRGLTLVRAVSLMEAAQRGDYADLQWTYEFIENTDPIPFTLVDRRASELLGFEWQVKVVDQSPLRRIVGLKPKEPAAPVEFDQSLAQEQAVALREAYDRVDNVYEAIEHMASATFRSYAHCQFHRNAGGDVVHFEPLNQWNFVRDGMFGDWKWNADARMVSFASLSADDLIDGSDFLIRTCRKHVDRIALIKFIRKNMGEKDWSGFVEIYGIPGVFIILPPNVSDAATENKYKEAAQRAAQSTSGSLPHGSDVKTLDSPRGINPFMEFIRFMDEQVVLAGTGGLLTVLSAPGSGTLAGSAHLEAFKAIARGEAMKISELFQRQFDKPLMAREFAGKPVLAYWELVANQRREPGSVLDDATKARSAGFALDAFQISEMTGYKLTTAPVQAAPDPAAAPPGRVMNRSEGLPTNPEYARESMRLLAEATRRDMAPVAAALMELYELADDPDADMAEIRAEAQRLLNRFPEIARLVLADPEAAKAHAQIMAGALANGVESAANEMEGAA